MIIVQSAAKINLTLEVLALRPDGYHELSSVVHTVGLWDTLSFSFAPGLSITCNLPHLANEKNLCCKALRLWNDAAGEIGHAGSGMQIHIEKHIPMGAGMGGGSGNAAATLLALNQYHQDLLDAHQLQNIAAKIGADVPLFLTGGCLLMDGIGENITPLRPLSGWIVAVQPPQSLSTPAVFRAWDNFHNLRAPVAPIETQAASPENAFGNDNNKPMMAAIETGDLQAVAKALRNDLAPAAENLGLKVANLKSLLLDSGALAAEMTGSGSVVFGIFESQSAAQEATLHLERQKARFNLNFVAAMPLCSESLRFSRGAATALK